MKYELLCHCLNCEEPVTNVCWPADNPYLINYFCEKHRKMFAADNSFEPWETELTEQEKADLCLSISEFKQGYRLGIQLSDELSIQIEIAGVYHAMFGETSLEKRLADIKEEAEELIAYTSPENLKEETSDLLCTVLALVEEQGWTFDEMVEMNLEKLAARKANGHYIKTGEAKNENIV